MVSEAKNTSRAVMLAIGGSDSCAGAGIQADLLTAHALGVRCLTAVVCLTSQTDTTFFDLTPVAMSVVQGQVRNMLRHYPVRAIKTGALATADIVRAVAECLPGRELPLVVDPVLGSTAAGDFTSDNSLATTYVRYLLPKTWLLTPNQHELTQLGGLRAVFATGVSYVLVTGGDAPRPVDRLYDAGGLLQEFVHEKLPLHLHGTGCRLATALTALVVRGMPLPQAAREAMAFVRQEIRQWGMPVEPSA